MLNVRQVIRTYQSGVEIKLKRKPHHQNLKGEYDPSNLEIRVYLPAQESKLERDITILHEMIHARDGSEVRVYSLSGYEKSIDKEARETYKRRPHVLEFVKQLYGVR